jgi:Ca2+-binding EF-hand superfamily protein
MWNSESKQSLLVLVGPAHHDTLLSVAIVMMSPEDEYDIKESFHVIDEEKTGEINIDQLETLCLGLGYNVEREELERSIQQTSTLNDSITVDIVLVLLSKVRVLVQNYAEAWMAKVSIIIIYRAI